MRAQALGACLLVGFPLLVILPTAVLLCWKTWRINSLLDRWACRNGYYILQAQRPARSERPARFRRTRANYLFRVFVVDRDGRPRSGYVRVGGRWGGIFVDAADAVWDDGAP